MRVRHVPRARVRQVSVRTVRFPVGFRLAARAPRARRHTLIWGTAHTRERARSLVHVHRASRRAHWDGA